LGMFGPITRSITNFCPTRLLCKRFNVAMPVHVVANDAPDEPQPSALPVATQMLNTNSKSQDGVGGTVVSASVDSVLVGHSFDQSRPPDHVFREIFGDSTDEEVI
jgi:G patch domain-containing protein 1